MGRSSGSRRGRGEPHSSSSASSSSSSLAPSSKKQSSNPKRNSLDFIHPTSSSNHSSAIPRGNGYQAMSIPMPPPPSLYFSLLPGSNGSNGGQQSGQQGSGSHSNSNSPRPSPAILHTSPSSNNIHNNNNKNNNYYGFLDKKTRSKSTSAKHRQPHHPPSIQFHLDHHSEPTTPASHPSLSSSHHHGNPSKSATNLHLQSPSNPTTPAIPTAPGLSSGSLSGTRTGAGGFNHYHTLHHPPTVSYPLSMTHSRRSSLSNPYGPSEKSDPQRQKGG